MLPTSITGLASQTDFQIKQLHAAEFRRCLIDLDVNGIRKLWAEVSPYLPQPQNTKEALFSLHMARTEAQSVPLGLRQYSHRWLRERGFGSMLPEALWPKRGAYRG